MSSPLQTSKVLVAGVRMSWVRVHNNLWVLLLLIKINIILQKRKTLFQLMVWMVMC
jgi:hypothetical protein